MAINMDENKTSDPVKQNMYNEAPEEWTDADEALLDIENTLGFLPQFVRNLTNASLPGAWQEVKDLYFNPNTALDQKLKNLIGLAVAAQMPDRLNIYFNKNSSRALGCTDQQIAEATTMSALTRHWSTFLNGMAFDKKEFQREADQIFSHVRRMMKQAGGKMPPEKTFIVNFSSVKETYEDIKHTMGLVPKFFLAFPEKGIVGAWRLFKGLQVNPYTALSNKQKELIGLAVASQIPCDYCIYFHRNAALLNGATQEEMHEAIAGAALSRQWSVIFNSAQLEESEFHDIADKIIQASHRPLSVQ
jgi:AhpD family alkylhydroperoxidase